ncbi:hypothetical protein [Streptomyces sp. NPDC048473]
MPQDRRAAAPVDAAQDARTGVILALLAFVLSFGFLRLVQRKGAAL